MKMNIEDISNYNGTAFTIEMCGELYLIAYERVIAKIAHGLVFLDAVYWNYSKTTSKYRNIFLQEDTKVTQKKLDQDIYKLTNLN